MTTNADLLVEVRDVADSDAWEIVPRLADALEASEAQVARLQAMFEAHEKMYHKGVPTVFPWPADLVEAVQHAARPFAIGHTRAECEKYNAVLVRYGLLPEEAR